ncbi:hypothetical protein [Streptomyces sp. NPDC005548]|uniref:hypothetical protein n=1 Tax=Streptomyces sp. NPDC005548 TaxID=3364724 RepID=UPI00369B2CF9
MDTDATVPDGPSETLLCTAETWPYIVGTPRHAKLMAWLQANGIDPRDVSVTNDLKIVHTADGPVIDHHVHLRNSNGSLYVDPDNPPQPAQEHRTTPCTVPPPPAKRADITTRALLQCVVDRTSLRKAVPLLDSLQIPRAWDLLCTVHPEKVVGAAFDREEGRGYLDCGINITWAFLTPEGEARLVELGGAIS